MTKDNIMKQADGLFHKIFDKVAREYPEIENNHMIIDIGSAIIADRPHSLDVVVTQNLYGDIISDIAAQVTGSVGLGSNECNLGVQNNSSDRYQISVELIEFDASRNRRSAGSNQFRLGPNESRERTVRTRRNTSGCALILTRWRKLK